jgi:hypothetical protein
MIVVQYEDRDDYPVILYLYGQQNALKTEKSVNLDRIDLFRSHLVFNLLC